MAPLKPFVIAIWILLPTVMFGGFSLLRLLPTGKLTPFQVQFFRAGHAHAGVLLVMSLIYCHYLAQTTLSDGLKRLAIATLLVGILAQSGGFFLHMLLGQPGQSSAGNTVTFIGAGLLAAAIVLLVVALISQWKPM